MYKHKCNHNVKVDDKVYSPDSNGILELPIIYKSASCEPLEEQKQPKKKKPTKVEE